MSNRAATIFAGASEEELALLQKAVRGPDFSYSGRVFLAKIVECYDGDTVRATFSPGEIFPAVVQYKIRLLGCDSCEMKPPLKAPDRELEKAMALDARDALEAKICPDLVVIECGEFDKNGRILATIYLRDGENVNAWIIANGYGWPYDGKNKATAREAGARSPALQRRRREIEERLSKKHQPENKS